MRQHLEQLTLSDRYPALVVDSVGDPAFADVAEAGCIEQLVDQVWKHRRHARYVPREDPADDMERIARACIAGHCCHLVIDESAYYLDCSRGRGGALERLLRIYRHCDVTIQATTQHFSGDVSQAALSCSPRLFVFRTASTAALDALERHFQLDRATVQGLPNRKFLIGG
jgi:hypothetical protein